MYTKKIINKQVKKIFAEPASKDDIDPVETNEWIESLNSVIENDGSSRASYLLNKVIDQAYKSGLLLPDTRTTPYINTIPPEAEIKSPGDQNIEKKININEMHESPLVMLLPLFVLAIGAIFAGFLFKDLFISHSGGNSFWGDSIKFLNPLSTEHPPLWFLLTTPALVLTSIPIAYYLFVKDKNVPHQIAQSNRPLHNFLINKWYFDELYNVLFIKFSKKLGIFFWKAVDVKIIDKFGPDGVSSLIKSLSIKASKFQSGFIYQYAFMILLGFSALLTSITLPLSHVLLRHKFP